MPASEQIRLSPPALETLAVVAYRQPVLRAEVEAIRGVACGEILRQLMDRDLLRIVGRSEELGRPLWYGTTKRFLEVFGLCNLDQLPLAAQLRRTGNASHGERIDAASKPPSRRTGADRRRGRRLDLVILYRLRWLVISQSLEISKMSLDELRTVSLLDSQRIAAFEDEDDRRRRDRGR